MKILLPLLFAIAASQNVSDDTGVANNITWPLLPEEVIAPRYDFIVIFKFYLEETEVPQYVVHKIFEDPAQYYITTNDTLALYNIQDINLSLVTHLLNELNISTSAVLSLSGFDIFLKELHIDFRDIYTNIFINRFNVSGASLRNFLSALDINANDFSSALAFGDPDPYETIQKGNYSKEQLENALEHINKTPSELFDACRDEFVSKAITMEVQEMISILKKYDFGQKEALKVWNILNITMDDIAQVLVIENLLRNLASELNQRTSLGILTSETNITINKIFYESWKTNRIANAHAAPVDDKSNFSLIVERELNAGLENENIIVLRYTGVNASSDNLTYISFGETSENLKNCTFVTLQNSSLISINVDQVINRNGYLEINKNITEELILGSPLICDNVVYGLAKEIVSENIILDSLFVLSGQSKFIFSKLIIVLSVLMFVVIY